MEFKHELDIFEMSQNKWAILIPQLKDITLNFWQVKDYTCHLYQIEKLILIIF